MSATDLSARWRQYHRRRQITVEIISLLFISSLFLIFTPHDGVWGQSNETVNVAYFENRPLSFESGTGDVVGLSIDLLRHIAEEENWDLDLRKGTRDDCHSWLEDGSIDVVVGMEETEEVKNFTTFSNEIIVSNWGVIFASRDRKLDSILDLDQKWVGVVKDDIYYTGDSGLKELISAFKIESSLVEFDNYNELIDALEDGQLDAGLLNHLLGQVVEHERDIDRTGIVLNPLEIRFAFPANGSKTRALSTLIDSNLEDLKRDEGSTYYQLLEEYIGVEGGSEVKVIPTWLIHLFIIVVGVAIFLFALTMFLRYRVSSKTKELVKTNEQLDLDIRRRRDVEKRLKDERNRSVFYLDLLVHDVGNINQGLLNSSQIYNMMKDDRTKADKIHETIEQLVKRSVSLLKNVHKFAQATTAPFNPEPTELMPTLKKGLAGVILSFPDLEINFEIKGPEKKVLIPAEPLLEEVFYNIFHNAVKYHELGDPRIAVRVNVNEAKKEAIVVIEDRGRGIPDNMKDRLFTRMDQAEEAKHLGMGLSLVKVLLDRYNSTITAQDRVPGNHKMGSKFIITLPIMEVTSNPLKGPNLIL